MHSLLLFLRLNAPQENVVKLGDFGISVLLASEDELLNGSKGGTPAFEAPEICAGVKYRGQAADIWALGVTAFVLVHGCLPFEGKSLNETFVLHISGASLYNFRNAGSKILDVDYCHTLEVLS